MTTLKPTDIKLRYANRGDISDMARIDVSVFEQPLTMKMLIERLEQEQIIIEVAEQENQGVNAYLISQPVGKTIKLLRLAAYPEYWILGGMLVGRRTNEVFKGRKDKVQMYVPESMLTIQLLLKQKGFRATHVARNYFPETDESAYLMEFTVADQVESGNTAAISSY